MALFLASGADAADLKVGAHLPLSGSLSRAGQAFLEGITIGLKVCNADQNRHNIALASIDDESQPGKAVTAVEKLVADGAVALLGGYGSNIVGPASDAANRLNTVYISAGAVSDELVQRGNKNYFRINNNAGYERGAEELISSVKPAGVSIIASTKEAPMLLAQGIEKRIKARGIPVTLHPFDPAITDFKPIVNKVKLQDKSDVIYMSGYENDYVGILRAAKVLKPTVKMIAGPWSLATAKMYKDFPDLMENVIGSTFLPYPVEMNDKEGKRFSELYNEGYKKEVDYSATLAYVKTVVLCEAIVRAADAGALQSDSIRAELKKTKRDSLLGVIAFNEVGDNENFSMSMGQHRNGKIVLVSPKAKATGELVYPGLPW